MGAICSRPVIANDKLSRQGHLEDITVERSKEKLSRQRQLGDSTVEGSKEKISKNRVSTEITEIHRTGGTVFPNAVPRDNTKVIENSKDSPFAIQPGWTSKIAEHGTAAVTNTHNDHVTPTLRIIQSDESKVAEKRKTSPCLDEVSNDNEDIDEYAREYASDRQIQTALERIRIKAYDNLAIGNGECRSLSNNETITASKLLIQRVNWAIREVTVSTWKETNGEYTQSAKHLLHVFDEAYEFLLELKVPVEYVVENRKSIANIALNADIIERMCEMVITIYQGKLVSDINNSSFWDPLCLSMGILWNYTDTSEEWAERVANTPGLLDIIYKILTDIRTTEATSVSTWDIINWITTYVSK